MELIMRKINLLLVVSTLLFVNILHAQIFEVGGDVSGAVWGNDTYWVTSDIWVENGSTLWIDPGATVKFQSGKKLTVYGELIVAGVNDSYVKFTSRDDNMYGDVAPGSDGAPEQGDWGGIHIIGTGDNQGRLELAKCRIMYGGGIGYNLHLNESDYASLTDSYIEYSSSIGLLVTNCNPIFPGQIDINENNGYAMKLIDPLFDDFSSMALYGNKHNVVAVQGNVRTDLTWDELDFVLTASLTIETDMTLTIQPGVIIKSTGVYTGFNVYGTLDANGTEANPVIFTSFADDTFGGDTNDDGGETVPAPGNWSGILLNGLAEVNQGIGEFDWTQIRYGGYGNGNADANVNYYYSDSGHFVNSISEFSSLPGIETTVCSPEFTNSIFRNNNSRGLICNTHSGTITENTFSDNGNDGLYVSGDCTPTITNNTFNNNDGYGAYLNNIHLTSLPGNTGTGNTYNAITLSGTVDTSFEFTNLIDFPYVMHGDITVNTNNTLTIAAGTIMKFNGEYNGIDVYGTLDANGTEANPVIFTSFADDTYGGDSNGDGGCAVSAHIQTIIPVIRKGILSYRP